MASHVCDTRHAICQRAWLLPCLYKELQGLLVGGRESSKPVRGAARIRGREGRRMRRKGEEKGRKGKEEGRKGKEKGKKKREEERGGREEKERGR